MCDEKDRNSYLNEKWKDSFMFCGKQVCGRKKKKMENLLFEKENWKPYLIITYSHGLYCYLEREILLHILDDDDQER